MSNSRHQPTAPTAIRELAAAAGVTAHWHDEHQIVYASRGVVAVHTETSRWIAPAHRALWIPAGTVHAHRAYGVTRLHFLGLTQNPLKLHEPTALTVSPLLRELLIAGQGVAALPLWLVHADIADGRLRELLPGHELDAIELHALYPSSRFLPSKVRMLVQFLQQQLQNVPGML